MFYRFSTCRYKNNKFDFKVTKDLIKVLKTAKHWQSSCEKLIKRKKKYADMELTGSSNGFHRFWHYMVPKLRKHNKTQMVQLHAKMFMLKSKMMKYIRTSQTKATLFLYDDMFPQPYIPRSENENLDEFLTEQDFLQGHDDWKDTKAQIAATISREYTVEKTIQEMLKIAGCENFKEVTKENTAWMPNCADLTAGELLADAHAEMKTAWAEFLPRYNMYVTGKEAIISVWGLPSVRASGLDEFNEFLHDVSNCNLAPHQAGIKKIAQIAANNGEIYCSEVHV